jgi:hypothetical protein
MTIAEFISRVEGQVNRSRWWRDDDLRQVFWLGVVESFYDLGGGDTQMAFIVQRGRGAVRNEVRANWSRVLRKRCPGCGREYGYRTTICRGCGVELVILSRYTPYIDSYTDDAEDVERVDLDLFVLTLDGRQAYVARRWLIDRADLCYENHLQQIASELGISDPAVARMKRIIRRRFREWYDAG